jgi:hypothetical protein
MTRAPLGPEERRAVRDFVDAVHALSNDPGHANLQRYLAVSRQLEESRRPREHPIQGRTRAGGRSRRPVRVDAAKADA